MLSFSFSGVCCLWLQAKPNLVSSSNICLLWEHLFFLLVVYLSPGWISKCVKEAQGIDVEVECECTGVWLDWWHGQAEAQSNESVWTKSFKKSFLKLRLNWRSTPGFLFLDVGWGNLNPKLCSKAKAAMCNVPPVHSVMSQSFNSENCKTGVYDKRWFQQTQQSSRHLVNVLADGRWM